MTLTISRQIPTHTKTFTALWCKKNWVSMSQRYRAIRGRLSNPMDTCYWCRYKFADGDMMALACPSKGSNKVLCQQCAEQLEVKP